MPTSIAELQEIVAQNSVSIRELVESQKETDSIMKDLAKSQKATELALRETQRAVQETERVLRENSRETELALQDLKFTVKEVTLQMGGVGNDIGEIYEMVLLPGLLQKMNELGHNFIKSSHRNKFSKPMGGNFTEIDLVLENCNEIMFVEVKSDFKPKWVLNFIERIKLLRQNEALTGLAGKTIYAAAAGIRFNNETRDLAAEYGMYLIEVDEKYENDKLTVIPPPDGKAGKW